MSYRDHAPYHERRLEQQMLDTLLRIEEMLGKALADDAPDSGPPIEELITNIEPRPTPFLTQSQFLNKADLEEAKAKPKGKRK